MIALEDITNLSTLHPTLSSLLFSYFNDLVSKKDLYEKMQTNNNNEYSSVHITATGTLTDNPKSLAEMESNDALP